MTILTASAKLYEWFTENDSFCLEYDFNKLFQEDQDKDRESACVINALEQFNEMQFTSSAEVGGRKVWTLRRPLNSLPQTVELGPDACLQISHVINGFSEYIGDDSSMCDPANISEVNVLTLVTICATLIKDKTEEDANDTGLLDGI